MRILNSGLVGIGTSAPTHSLTFPSTTTGIVLHNQADQTTNYERVRISPVSNVWEILSEKGGTGTARAIKIGTSANNITFGLSFNSFAGSVNFNGGTMYGVGTMNTTASVPIIMSYGTTSSISSGLSYLLDLRKQVNQTGTAGYTAHRITVYEQGIGSGTKNLIDAGTNVSGFGTHATKFAVSNIGKMTIATGTNASVDTGTFSGGTVTINNTAVTASSKIAIHYTSCSSCGTAYVATITAGTSFVVSSSNGSDASTFWYQIIN